MQAVVGNLFAIERELGGGGMSRVFLATETSLGRKVVVKVLPHELVGAISTEPSGPTLTVADWSAAVSIIAPVVSEAPVLALCPLTLIGWLFLVTNRATICCGIAVVVSVECGSAKPI